MGLACLEQPGRCRANLFASNLPLIQRGLADETVEASFALKSAARKAVVDEQLAGVRVARCAIWSAAQRPWSTLERAQTCV